MSTYAQAEQEIKDMIGLMLQNQTFCKLIYYDNDSPLSQPDIIDTSKLLFTSKNIGQENQDHRIFYLPKSPDVKDTAKTLIIPKVYGSLPLKNKDYHYKYYTIKIDILTHQQLWNLSRRRYKGVTDIRPI